MKKSYERDNKLTMKKVKVEVESTLTYTPFENIGELLKKKKKEVKANGRDNTTSIK